MFDSRKKILFVIPYLGNGGSERVMLTLLNNLSREKYDLNLCVIKEKGNYFSKLKEDVKVHCLHCTSFQRSFFKTCKCIRDVNPDIVVGFMSFVIIHLGLMKKIFFQRKIFIGRETGLPSIRHKRFFLHNNLLLCRFGYGQMDAIVCQGKDQLAEVSLFYKIDISKLKLIRNPTQCPAFVGQILRTDSKTVDLISAGSLTPRKYFHAAIEAIRLCNDENIKLHIYGQGLLKPNLAKFIKQSKLEKQVFLHGFTDSLTAKFTQFDAFLLTSLSEPCSNALLEAQAHGLPAIAFDCPGATKEIIIQNKTGILISRFDIRKLAQSLAEKRYLLMDRQLIHQTIKDKFGLEVSLREYENLFDNFFPYR